jgi:hypothetical protein
MSIKKFTPSLDINFSKSLGEFIDIDSFSKLCDKLYYFLSKINLIDKHRKHG